uniref:Ig-like domain-containing protein n=1 Tax=Mastacembelus armatus TaxID=205130 RepID=A0A7N8YLS4_9TELE
MSMIGCCDLDLILLSGPGDVTVKVTVGDDAILPCSLSTRENIVQNLFQWRKDGQKKVFLYDGGLTYSITSPHQDEQFKGRVFHFPDQLQFGNASIVIRNTKVTDSGNYTCDFPHLETGRLIFHISLIVGEYFDKTVSEVSICELQYGFMPRKRTTDAIFALRMLMEKYREGQKEQHCVFVDLEKAYDRVLREELGF